jgi:ubiquinone/menaquinone biosynthesis C-methylase UbiE
MSRAAETDIGAFWEANPCGEELVGGRKEDWAAFYEKYDAFRYRTESHIPVWIDQLGVSGLDVLEIGLGQGADSEQLIRRGARWTGIDLTAEAVARTRRRLDLKTLPYTDVLQGSAVRLPFADASFDLVYSFGVLHHIPDIEAVQAEIARVLRPGGRLAVMLYARRSLNYWLSIGVVRRLGLLALHLAGRRGSGIYAEHLANARQMGIGDYLKMSYFIHRNTDGPANPYSKVYDVAEIERDFVAFETVSAAKHFMHAPPLPVRHLPFASMLGWHLCAVLKPRRH